MKLQRAADFTITSILLPGGWDRDLDEAHIAQIAEKLAKGHVYPPIRLNADHELVYGRHRLKGHLAAGLKTIRVDIVSYQDELEEREDAAGENLERVSYTTEQKYAALAELVEIRRQRLIRREAAEAEQAADDAERVDRQNDERTAPRKPGGQSSAERQAIKQVAAERGVGESTVERAVRAQEPTPAPAKPASALDWFDLEPVLAVEEAAARVQPIVADLDGQLKAIARRLTALEEAGLPNGLVQQVRQHYQTFAWAVRRARPKTACPWCKGRAFKDCYPCGQTGYFTEHQADADIPKELILRGPEAMVTNGKGGYRKLSRPVKQLTRVLVDADGNETVLPPDDGEAA